VKNHFEFTIIRVLTCQRQAPGSTLQKLLVVDPLLMAKIAWSARRSRYDITNPGIEQLPVLLAGAIVVINARGECSGIPQKLLNYMAAGYPVVTCAGSARNISNSETGLVVPNGDVAAFRDAILRLLDDEALATRLGHNVQTHVHDNMSWEHAARSIEAVYDRLTLNPRKS